MEKAPQENKRAKLVAYWTDQIESYEKQYEPWTKACEDIFKRYRDEENYKARGGRYNIFYSNVQTMLPAVYNNAPTPVVERRNKSKDVLGRVAAILLENATDTQLETYDFDYMMRCAALDWLLSGRGQAWVRYDAQTAPVMQQVLGEDGMPVEVPATDMQGQPMMQKTYEAIACDFVPYTNFGHTPARNWSEVRAVWKSTLMGREELRKRFPKVGDTLPLNYAEDGARADKRGGEGRKGTRALIYEIWDKDDKKVLWLSKDHTQEPLDEADDPLGLQDFFPCPRPLYGLLASDSLRPMPDYQLVRHQLEEIDSLTKRINNLSRHLKVAGVYDGSNTSLPKLISSDSDQMIAVKNWNGLSEKGGIKGAVDFLPIVDVVNALQQAVQMREQIKRDVDEITGISDIIRGQGVASETATAQRIKGNFATMRLDDRKAEVARFARDLVRIKAEIIAEMFDEATILACTDLDSFSPEEQASIPQAIQLLRDQKQRGFRIEIETDSTVAADEERERAGRTEFLSAIGGFMQQALPVVQAAPQTAPIVAELMLFTVRTFSKGRALESAFDAFAKEMIEGAKSAAQAGAQPTPEQQIKEREVAVKEFDAQTKRITATAPQPILM